MEAAQPGEIHPDARCHGSHRSSRSGTTVFLTTHYIEEAERLCERIAFIVSGRIVRVDAVERLVQSVQGRHIVQIACTNPASAVLGSLIRAFPHLAFQALSARLIQVEAEDSVRVGPLVRFLEDQGAEVTEARRMRPSLEDAFVRITGIEVEAMRKEKERVGGSA